MESRPTARSPDVATVVYSWMNPDGSSIMIFPLAGGAPTELNRGSHWWLVPNISPDGGRIAFTSDLDGPSEPYTIAINGFDVPQLTFTDPPFSM